LELTWTELMYPSWSMVAGQRRIEDRPVSENPTPAYDSPP
jgi:hypothetical protein